MKKVVIFIIILLVIFGTFAIFQNIPKDYKYEYKIDKFDIIEKYDKKKKVYTFNIKNKEVSFDYAMESEYHFERGLITKLKLKDSCLDATLDKLDDFVVCQNDEGYFAKYYDSVNMGKKKSSYENINIYNLNKHSYLIWNYDYFVGINDEKKEKITLFDEDFIKLNLVTKYQDKLVVADYNEDNIFKKLYVIDPFKMKTDVVKLDLPIYLNSYFLGEYKDYLYLFDIQAKQEYKIDIDEGLVYRNKPEILNNGKMEESSTIKLSKNELTFTYKESFMYSLEDSKLYYQTPVSKILITNMNIDKLVYQEGKEAYFLVSDTLYYVHLDKGIQRLLSYSEWQFNNSNIYIF